MASAHERQQEAFNLLQEVFDKTKAKKRKLYGYYGLALPPYLREHVEFLKKQAQLLEEVAARVEADIKAEKELFRQVELYIHGRR